MPGTVPDELTLNIAGHEIPYTPNEEFELTITPNGYEKRDTPMTNPSSDVIGAYELYTTDDGKYRVTLDSKYAHKNTIKNLSYSCDSQWNPGKNAWTLRFMNPNADGKTGLRLAAQELLDAGLTLHITPTLVQALIDTQQLE
jgi:hypothetical protein